MSRPPAISVVVPVYDVERYLDDCLTSIAAQQLADLEVICVDDGSTDASGDIADAFAARDPRFRVLHQANAGLGAARNAGAAQATGTYLAFVDSDDVLPPDAYARLHASLEGSGSDFAVGDIRRLTSLGVRPSPTFSPIYSPARRATHVTRDHALLRDRIAPNKLWRRSFWSEHAFAFPVGVLHEDIALVLSAHVLADAVDVISTPVYLWRIRAGADRSITQRRLELGVLRDRVAAVTTVSRFLAERGLDAEKRAYDLLVMTDELRLHARLLDRATPEYRDVFLAEAQAFLAQAHPDALADAPAIERLRWTLVRDGSLDELAEIARFERTEAAERPAIALRGGRVEGDLPFRRGRRPALPAGVFRYDQELALQTRVTGFTLDERRLVVEGWAALRHVAVPRPARRRVRMWLVRRDDDERIELAVEPTRSPEASARAVPDLYDLSGAGFRATVALDQLTTRWGSGVDRWDVEVEVRGGTTVRSGPLAGPEPGAPRRPPAVDVGRLRVGPRVDDGVVSVVVAARVVTVVGAEVGEDTLTLDLTSRRSLTDLRCRTPGQADRTLPVVATAAGRFRVEVPVAPFVSDAVAGGGPDGAPDGRPAGSRTFALHAIDGDGRAARLIAADGLDQPVVTQGGCEVVLDITRYGYTALVVRPASLWLERAEPAPDGPDDGFLLHGRYAGPGADELQVSLVPAAKVDPRPLGTRPGPDGIVAVDVPIRSRPAGEPHDLVGDAPGDVPLDAGVWHLRAAVPGPDDRSLDVEVRTRRSLVAALPVDHVRDRKRFVLDDRSWHQPAVTVTDDLEVEERGRFHQRRMWDKASRGSRRRLDARVVCVAGDGRRVGGDVRAVYDELRRVEPDLEVVWAVRDAQATAPQGTRPVRVGTQAWHDVLARSTAIVSDTPLPRTHERAAKQRCVRLWSGVPIRPLGADAAGVIGAERPADAARSWSDLVAPGDEAADVLTRAFAFDGAVHPVGLPRHDVLADPAAAVARAEALRVRLGAADGPVVLYLPTWLDAERHPGGALRHTPDLDLSALAVALGADARVWARVHPAVVDTVAEAAGSPRVADLSRHPDVTTLLLAADVVVAHPSSVVLEAVRCGTPVVVHDPPGAGVATQLGTPYRDLLAPAVPWRVARDEPHVTAEVAAALLAGRGVTIAQRVATAATVPAEVHGETTTGDAAARVVDLVCGDPA